MKKTEYKPGMYDISNEEYHASSGVSRSALWTYKQLPKKYWYEYLSGEYVRPAETESFLIGSMLHTMMLEPELFESSYYVMPKVNRATKAGKIAYSESFQLAAGRTLITDLQLLQVHTMCKQLKDQALVSNVLLGSIVEKSIYWEDEETGLICKCRPDLISDLITADLKSTDDASPRGFQNSAMKYGYMMQAAMIFEGLQSIGQVFEKFLFICVEKKQPYATALYLLDDEALQYGRDQFHKTLRQFVDSYDTNYWPDYGVQNLTVPHYATKELLNDD